MGVGKGANMALAGDGGRWHGVGSGDSFFFFLARDDGKRLGQKDKGGHSSRQGSGPPATDQGHQSAKQTRPSFSGASSNIKASCKAQFNESVSQSYAHGLESSAIRTHCNLAGHDLSIMASKTQPPPPPLPPRFSRHKPTPHAIPNVCCPPQRLVWKEDTLFWPSCPRMI